MLLQGTHTSAACAFKRDSAADADSFQYQPERLNSLDSWDSESPFETSGKGDDIRVTKLVHRPIIRSSSSRWWVTDIWRWLIWAFTAVSILKCRCFLSHFGVFHAEYGRKWKTAERRKLGADVLKSLVQFLNAFVDCHPVRYCRWVRDSVSEISRDCGPVRSFEIGKASNMEGKQSHYRPEVAHRVPGSRKLNFPDFVTTAQDSGKVVSLTHRPTLPPGNAPGTHFC